MIESITQSLMEKYYSLRSKEQSNKTLEANSSTSNSITNHQQDKLYTPSMKNIDVIEDSYAPFLQVDRNNNLSIEKNKVYSIKTDYGVINYKFHHNNDSRYVETLHFDNKISDEKRVHLEKTRQFLTHLQTFAETGRINIMYTARDASEVLEGFKRLGINTEEPFTINDNPTRYRIDPSGVIHEVDFESKGMKEKDWRKFGHDENTIFIIQGKEYKIDENGKLPLPDDYVHKHEQVQIINE